MSLAPLIRLCSLEKNLCQEKSVSSFIRTYELEIGVITDDLKMQLMFASVDLTSHTNLVFTSDRLFRAIFRCGDGRAAQFTEVFIDRVKHHVDSLPLGIGPDASAPLAVNRLSSLVDEPLH